MSVCIQYIRYTIHYTLYSSRLHSALYSSRLHSALHTVYTSAESGGTRRTDPALHSEASSIRHTDRAAQPRASCRQANLAHPLVNPCCFLSCELHCFLSCELHCFLSCLPLLSLLSSLAFSLVNSFFSRSFRATRPPSSSLGRPRPKPGDYRGTTGGLQGTNPDNSFLVSPLISSFLTDFPFALIWAYLRTR